MTIIDEFAHKAGTVAETVAETVKEKAPEVIDAVQEVAGDVADVAGAAFEAGKNRAAEIKREKAQASRSCDCCCDEIVDDIEVEVVSEPEEPHLYTEVPQA